MISRLTCPTCRRIVDPDVTPAMPFCSPRCKLIDLGEWLDEQVGIPLQPEDHSEYREEGKRD